MYGRDALRRLREQQSQAQQEPERPPSLLEQIPVDAPMDDATLTVWNGERWVAWDTWLATAPLVCDDQPEASRPEGMKAQKRPGKRAGEAPDVSPQGRGVQEGLW